MLQYEHDIWAICYIIPIQKWRKYYIDILLFFTENEQYLVTTYNVEKFPISCRAPPLDWKKP